ncbi:hypothetical protein BOTBODRAFT_168506 [Botryobasidium botryosum FD-172 SS1]|uniref:Uncharacterized protein n=1 Tax=Botryobasidium botryosum (strain FD-172 SS1) TaxID=930990 RepID=A0A067NAL6_BOTB1|nr:hypothetical protein BOTBODRAFT_168506 [Botryobasidium botryosum FD-172 SS1]
MPLFASRTANQEPADSRHGHTNAATDNSRRRSLFSKDPTPAQQAQAQRDASPTKRGFFSKGSNSRNAAQEQENNHNSGHFGTNTFGMRTSKDPSIAAARQKVSKAEESERAAQRALQEAKGHLEEARNHVGRLENEAQEEAKQAQRKADEIKGMRKNVNGLGKR